MARNIGMAVAVGLVLLGMWVSGYAIGTEDGLRMAEPIGCSMPDTVVVTRSQVVYIPDPHATDTIIGQRR